MSQLNKEELRTLACKAQVSYLKDEKFPKTEMTHLWNAILPFVHKYCNAKSVKANGQFKMDLIQVSYEALCAAIRNYNPEKMDDFFKYVVKWIVAYTKVEQAKHLSIFRFGTRKDRSLFFKISKIKDLPIEEQMKLLDVTEQELAAFSEAAKLPKTIFKKNDSESDDNESEEYIASSFPTPDKFFDMKSVYEKSKKVFDEFESELRAGGMEKELAIFELLRRVGATEKGNFKRDEDETEPQSFADIAEKFGVTRAAISLNAIKLREKLKFRLEKFGVNEKSSQAFL